MPTGPTLTLGLTEGHLVTTTHGRAAALLITLLTAALATVALAAPAQAAAYRYWSYWQGDSGTWVAAQTGPGDHTLVDSDVQGWRFAVTAEAPMQGPDNAPVFADLCPDLSAAGTTAGQLRVAVVIDAGYIADAPAGQIPPADVVSCVTLPEGSTGNQALAAAGAVSEDGGLICSINGYPEGECAAEVSDADAAAAATAAEGEQANPAVVAAGATDQDTTSTTDSGGNSRTGFAVGALILALLLGAAFWIPAQRRRSRSAQ
ncbi:MAG TPA: SCO2322 family protein [Motilibacterales bacterium]|nr:SCO2322 family protein [Motilibacterales bacterium]